MSRRSRAHQRARAQSRSHEPSAVIRLGRHELGQNFLVDKRVIADVVDLVAATRGPILEIGPGDGALTHPLAKLGRPIQALELDARRAARLSERTSAHVQIECADALRHRFETSPHVVVSSLPFHVTTAMLRRLFAAPGWTDAALISQWEVARRRAGVGGASQLTAQVWPWFEFTLGRRIPRTAFRPMPQVDGGLFTIHRRDRPLVSPRDRRAYAAFVARCFASPGVGLAGILAASSALSRRSAKRWLQERGHAAVGLPRDLDATDWASLWERHRSTEEFHAQ